MKPRELDYPEGSLLFDVRYSRNPESFEVIYLDPITEQLEVKYEDALIDIWFLRPEERTNKYQIAQVEIDRSYPVYCKPSQVAKVIAKEIGGEWERLYEEKRNYMDEHELTALMCECPWVFKADFTPDVYFRLRWINKYGKQCDATKATKAFVDIEVDVLDRAVDPKDINSAPQPINAVSVILPKQKICALLVLGPRPRHLLDPKFHKLLDLQEKEFEWLVNHQEEFKRMIVDDDDDNAVYLKGYDIRIHIFDYYEEGNLIQTVFAYLTKYRPMFTLSWNAEFDDNYLIARLRQLGYDPCDVIIPKEFKTRKIYYKQDKRKDKTMKTAKDFMFRSTYDVMMCQMKNFAHIRKSQQERRSYSLSAIGKSIAKIDKLSDTKSGTFREFAYTNFLKFLLYNVRDVVVQVAIESVCNDCQSLLSRSYQFATQYSKCFEETHIVRNTREYYFEKQGYVQACRLIVDKSIQTAFKGAFVADPAKNAPTGYVLNGKRINNIIIGAVDADAAAYYPSTKMGCNLDPMSLLYKTKIDNVVFMNQAESEKYAYLLNQQVNQNLINKCTNHSMNQEYIWYDAATPPRPHPEDMSGPIFNSFKNNNVCSVLHNWFNVPTVTDIFSMLDAVVL